MDRLEALERIEEVCREMRGRKVNHGKSTSPTLIAWAARIEEDLAAVRAQVGGEAVAWRRPTPYGVGYSFASEEIMQDLSDWLHPHPSPAVVTDSDLRSLLWNVVDNLNDLPVNEDWAERTAAALTAALTPQEPGHE